MREAPPTRQSDTLLKPFLEARAPADGERHLAALAQEAEPVLQEEVRRRVRSLCGADDHDRVAEALTNEARAQLVARLQRLKTEPGADGITSFSGFAATTAREVCSAYVRRHCPQRASLRNRLFYLLCKRTGQRGISVWDSADGECLCGFDIWRQRGKGLIRTGRYQQLLENPRASARAALPDESPAQANPATLLAGVFDWVGCPIEFEDLVRVVAEIWGVRDVPPPPGEPAGGDAVPVPKGGVRRDHLRRLWSEIRQLPARQCAALLLNLRDEQDRGVIELLPVMGIAGPSQIAAALGLSPERFAALWCELPVDDAAIGRLLECSPEQVASLRTVARERLARRLRGT